MTISPSVTLRQLAEAATPGPWAVIVEDAELPDPNYGPILAFIEVGNRETSEMVCDCIPHLNDGSWEGEGPDAAHAQCCESARLIALAPALTVWAADAADALDEIEGSPEDPLHVQKVARSVLARLGDLVAHPADDRGTVSSLGSGPVVYKSGKPRVGCLKGQRHDWGAA
jgi:hypothetical protein